MTGGGKLPYTLLSQPYSSIIDILLRSFLGSSSSFSSSTSNIVDGAGGSGGGGAVSDVLSAAELIDLTRTTERKNSAAD